MSSRPTSADRGESRDQGRRGRARTHWAAAAAIAAIFMPAHATIAAADNHSVPRVAFFGFQLINTSLEPSTSSETGRIKMLDDLLRERLDSSGRFKIVPIPPGMQRQIADGPEISGCNGCERGYATTIGAD
jgi:hypothetical protein